jgi:hypothetical protein
MIFNVTKTEKAGGGWLVNASTMVYSEQGYQEANAGVWAFRTLDAARKFIGTVVQTDKRVRMTKTNETTYIYRG